MEELTKAQVDWKKITIVGFLVLLTGLVFAGSTWYVADQFHRDELEVKNNEIADLTTELNQKKTPETKDEEGSKATEPKTTNKQQIYSNSKYSFVFEYPAGYTYKEYSCTEDCDFTVKVMSDAVSKMEGGPFPMLMVDVYPKKAQELSSWIPASAEELGYKGGLKAFSNNYHSGYTFERESLFGNKNIVYVFNENSYGYVVSGFADISGTPNINDVIKTFNAN